MPLLGTKLNFSRPSWRFFEENVMRKCESLGCQAFVTSLEMLCPKHREILEPPNTASESEAMHLKYPKYYKDVSTLNHIDVYAVHQLFAIDDPSGAIQHASKKLLLSGVRTGNKSKYKDIKEARDTLNRWLEMNQE